MQHGGTVLAFHSEYTLLFEPPLRGVIVVDVLLVVEVVGCLGDNLLVVIIVT